MKKLFLLFFVFYSIGVFANDDEYVFIGTDTKNTMSMYLNNIIRKNDDIKSTYYIWIKIVYIGDGISESIEYLKLMKECGKSVKNEYNFSYSISLCLINPMSYKLKHISENFYDKDDNAIFYSKDKESEEDWSIIKPNTMYDSVIKKAYLIISLIKK